MSLLTRFMLSVLVSVGFATAHAAPIVGQGTWETTLKARDINGHAVTQDSASAAFFYDTTLDVTWLANMNQNGTMNWGNAGNWADGLTTGGFTDWRLPTVIDSGAPGCNWSFAGTDCGYNTQTVVGGVYSEWAHLYYKTLGNLAYCALDGGMRGTCETQIGWGLSNTAYFQNMQSSAYWSGPEYMLSSSGGNAWNFRTTDGSQGPRVWFAGIYAVAVRPGDVLRDDGGTPPEQPNLVPEPPSLVVPEPHGLVLALTALAGLGVALRRRRAV